jgi:glycosyltransferase involved in cell wall biosynthesis
VKICEQATTNGIDNPSPRVSVVIPLYNAEEYIGEAIEGILAQTYRDYEIVVVDDGSTDRSAAIVSSFGAAVRYVFQPNAGVSAATNRGVSLAKGQLIAFLDNDDIWLPQKLERQVAYLDTHPECGFVNCDMQYISETGKKLDRILRGYNEQEPYVRLFQKGYVIMCSAVMIRRWVCEKAGGFDEAFVAAGLQDMEWMSRVVTSTAVGYVPETLVLYRDHAPRIPRDRARRNEEIYLNKLWERYGDDPKRRRFLVGERVAFLSNLGQHEIRMGQLVAGRQHLRNALSLSMRSAFVNPKMVVRSLLRLWRSCVQRSLSHWLVF